LGGSYDNNIYIVCVCRINMKKDKENCFYCKNKIDLKKDKFVALGTYDKGKTLDEVVFHFECWKEYINDITIKKFQNQANKIFEKINGAGIIKKILGAGKLIKALDKAEKEDPKEEIESYY